MACFGEKWGRGGHVERGSGLRERLYPLWPPLTPRGEGQRLTLPWSRGPGILKICANGEHHPRHYEDSAHPRHRRHCRGDGLDEPFSAGSSGALRHLPGEGFAALAHRAAFNGREEHGGVGKSFDCGVHLFSTSVCSCL